MRFMSSVEPISSELGDVDEIGSHLKYTKYINVTLLKKTSLFYFCSEAKMSLYMIFLLFFFC